jgi:hypothetical protein
MEVVFEDIWGLNAASWISFLKDFKSGSKYLEQAKLFLHYHIGQTCSPTEDKTSRESMHVSVISYFDYLHDLKSEKKGKEHEDENGEVEDENCANIAYKQKVPTSVTHNTFNFTFSGSITGNVSLQAANKND